MYKRLLFISCHKIWNGYGGREYNLRNRIKFLLQNEYEIDIFYCGYKKNECGNTNLNVNEYFVDSNSFVLKFFRICLSLFSKKKSLQSSLFISYKFKKELRNILKNNKYDIIIVDMIRLAPIYNVLRKYTNSKLILDMDDIISNRYNSSQFNTIGQIENKNPFISKLMQFKVIRTLVLKIESRKLSFSEGAYSRKYDVVTLVSRKEVDDLSKKLNLNNIYYLPMIVTNYNISISEYPIKNKVFNLGFAGLLKTPANFSTLLHIINDILPKLKFDFVFKVIGKVDNDIIEKFSNNHIVFTGFVDDFIAELKTLDLFICPMTFGTGIKTKILEAMSARIPVVTNSVGIEGMNVRNNYNVICIDNDDLFASFINENYNNKIFLNEIANNGYAYVERMHSEKIFFNEFGKILLFLEQGD